MAKKRITRSKKSQATARITCSAPDAHEILLAGSFNDWDPAALAMTRGADGEWSVELQLPPGRYEYKFVVDCVWCCEPHSRSDQVNCEDCVPNELGTLNRVLVVR